jgi:hypothetical protein
MRRFLGHYSDVFPKRGVGLFGTFMGHLWGIYGVIFPKRGLVYLEHLWGDFSLKGGWFIWNIYGVIFP